FSLAALLLIQDEYNSFALAGLAAGATAAGVGVAAPIPGGLVHRPQPRPGLLPGAFGPGLVTAALALSATTRAPPPLVLFLALMVGVLTPPISATLRTAWITLFDEGPVQKAAFALDAMATQLLFALGPLLTAIAVQLVGAGPTVILAGFLTVIGT